MDQLEAQQSQDTLAFEQVAIGDEVTPLVRGPLTTTHLMRWSAAIENWHRIHYDQTFATEHDKLPALLVNGTWKQHFLVQMMRQWLGPAGWLAHVKFEFRGMNLVGETLTAHGTVTKKHERDSLGFVVCEIGILNERGEESTPGEATGVLPLADSRVPYPFSVDGLHG